MKIKFPGGVSIVIDKRKVVRIIVKGVTYIGSWNIITNILATKCRSKYKIVFLASAVTSGLIVEMLSEIISEHITQDIDDGIDIIIKELNEIKEEK